MDDIDGDAGEAIGKAADAGCGLGVAIG